MENTLNQTSAWFRAIGLVSEKNSRHQKADGTWEVAPMKIESTKRNKYVDGQKTEEMIPCERLRGTISLKTSKGVQDFGINFYSKTSAGEDDKRWAMAKKIAEWVPEIDPKGEYEGNPSYVSVRGNVGIYDSVSKKDGKVYSNLQWNATNKCEHISDSESSGCTLEADCYYKSSKPETTVKDGETVETGRLLVTLYGADNHGACYPIDCYVEADLAEDFADAFKVGDTLSCKFNRTVKHYGGEKTTVQSGARTFGKNKSDVTVSTGYDREELILFYAEAVEEPDELVTEDEDGNEVEVKTKWINPKTMEKAINEREVHLDELAKKGKASGSTGPKSIKERKAEKKSIKSKTTTLPFDMDDDDDDDF